MNKTFLLVLCPSVFFLLASNLQFTQLSDYNFITENSAFRKFRTKIYNYLHLGKALDVKIRYMHFFKFFFFNFLFLQRKPPLSEHFPIAFVFFFFLNPFLTWIFDNSFKITNNFQGNTQPCQVTVFESATILIKTYRIESFVFFLPLSINISSSLHVPAIIFSQRFSDSLSNFTQLFFAFKI